jgi:hypothetical protein
MMKRMLEEVVHDLISSRPDKIPKVTHLRELEQFKPWRYFDEHNLRFLLHSRAGGAYHSCLELSEDSSTASFILVSPNDDWPYACFVANLNHSYSRQLTLIFVSDDRVDVDTTETAAVIQYLDQHVAQVLDELDILTLIVEAVERIVQEVVNNTSLAEPIKQLHLCNIRHIKLQRR